MKAEVQQVGQGRLLTHDELDPCCSDQLLPVSVTDGRVLQLAHRPEGGQHVFHGDLEPVEGVPASHVLVQCPDIL